MKIRQQSDTEHVMETMQTKITVTAPDKERKVAVITRLVDLQARMPGVLGVQMILVCRACDSPFALSMLEVFDVNRDNTVIVPNLCPSCGGYAPLDRDVQISYELGRFPSDRGPYIKRQRPKS
jgi:hypothetical protein